MKNGNNKPHIHSANEAEDLPSLLDTVLNVVVSSYNFDTGIIRLLNEAEGVIELQYSHGISPEIVKWTRRASIDEPLYDQVYRKGQPHFADEGAKYVLDISERTGASAVVAILFLSKERVIGNIGVGRFGRYIFNEEEKSFLLSIGKETGTAIAKMQAEATYHAIFDSVNDAIFTIDRETGAYLDVNDRACKLFGYTIDELRQLGAGDLSSGSGVSTKAHLRDVIAELWRTVKPQILEWEGRDISGSTFWVESNISCTVIGGRPCILAAMRDITARKRAEEALQQAHDELEQKVQERTTTYRRR